MVLNAAMSCFILFGELTSAISNNVPLKFITNKILDEKLGFVYTNGFIFIVLLYMGLLCFFGISYFRVLRMYGFWSHATDTPTLANSAIYLARITPPLLFNFTTCFIRAPTVTENTDFFNVEIS